MVDGLRTSWDEALDVVAKGFRDTIIKHGPDAVAFYVSGQILTEDYYVANKLMKGFIGSVRCYPIFSRAELEPVPHLKALCRPCIRE